MMYHPEKQYRCAIIRGKSQTEMENFLPVYLSMVHSQCPCQMDDFRKYCQRVLSKLLFQTENFDVMPESNRKTVNNHFTEIAGKLLGLYYETPDGYAVETELCQQLIETNDNSLFFKNLCYNFQFPNGTKKSPGIIEDIKNEISIKPYCFVIALLAHAQKCPGKMRLTKQEIGYYVLNNLEVLQGKIDYKTVYDSIIADRKQGITRPKLQGSFEWQHIKEQFNMLELTGMVECDKDSIWLNTTEKKSIEIFSKSYAPTFDLKKYFVGEHILSTLFTDWGRHYGSKNAEFENTKVSQEPQEIVLVDGSEQVVSRGSVGYSTIEIGDQGEALVYNLEKERVGKYKNARFVNKVLLLGKVKGLGYDITSIEADENPTRPEFARYIEVKSGNRFTEPNLSDTSWVASLNLSAKEWTAAEQYGEYYNIYIVYFITQTKKILVVRMKNPFDLFKKDKIDVFATSYRMTYNSTVLEKRFEGAQN